jgi:hypothetical protein
LARLDPAGVNERTRRAGAQQPQEIPPAELGHSAQQIVIVSRIHVRISNQLL